ncbi:MAG: rhomboid family intramembrane serine protease [Verrucomicrobia bacterium]|nr:rhomboid family intramembrane serine protease [Verrucomicrobiota bacterium]
MKTADATHLDGECPAIVARSRRQALDWSLVLSSQDIASTLRRVPETGRWLLEVDATDLERACDAIRLYQAENRGWNWRRPLPANGMAFHWGSGAWVILLGLIYACNVVSGNGLDARGVLDTQAVHAGQWWRLFTAVVLHANLGHLASNLSIGFLVLGLAMARFGAGFALLAAYLAGVGGNLIGLWLRAEPYSGLGASGMVMGGLGLLTAESVWLRRESPRAARYVLSGVLAGLLLLVWFGLDPQADVVAHVGGFVTGALLGAILAVLPDRLTQHTPGNLVAGALLAGLVLYPWWLAVH